MEMEEWKDDDRWRGGGIEKEGGVGPNVCMDFFVLTEYLVMSRLS